MITSEQFRFQPGWATPVPIDYRKPSFLAWFLGFAGERKHCRARMQGSCPGLDHCHDCAWSSHRESSRDS